MKKEVIDSLFKELKSEAVRIGKFSHVTYGAEDLYLEMLENLEKLEVEFERLFSLYENACYDSCEDRS